MTMQADGQNGSMVVTTKDVWLQLVQLRADVAVINSQGSPVFANFSSFTSTTANGSLFFSSTGGSVNNVTLPFNVFYFG